MILLLIIPLLASGFRLCHVHPYYQYSFHRQEGQYLYINCARTGLICFFISTLANTLYFLLASKELAWRGPQLPDQINFIAEIIQPSFAVRHEEAIKLSWYFWISLIAIVVVPHVWVLMSRLKLRRRGVKFKAQQLYILKSVLSKTRMGKFLSDALTRKEAVMLSMDDKKVYVGVVVEMGEPSETDDGSEDIVFRPIISGYRCKDHLMIHFTTHYSAVNKDLIIVLKKECIVSASYFDEEVFSAFQKDHATRDHRAPCCGQPILVQASANTPASPDPQSLLA